MRTDASRNLLASMALAAATLALAVPLCLAVSAGGDGATEDEQDYAQTFQSAADAFAAGNADSLSEDTVNQLEERQLARSKKKIIEEAGCVEGQNPVKSGEGYVCQEGAPEPEGELTEGQLKLNNDFRTLMAQARGAGAMGPGEGSAEYRSRVAGLAGRFKISDTQGVVKVYYDKVAESDETSEVAQERRATEGMKKRGEESASRLGVAGASAGRQINGAFDVKKPVAPPDADRMGGSANGGGGVPSAVSFTRPESRTGGTKPASTGPCASGVCASPMQAPVINTGPLPTNPLSSQTPAPVAAAPKKEDEKDWRHDGAEYYRRIGDAAMAEADEVGGVKGVLLRGKALAAAFGEGVHVSLGGGTPEDVARQRKALVVGALAPPAAVLGGTTVIIGAGAVAGGSAVAGTLTMASGAFGVKGAWEFANDPTLGKGAMMVVGALPGAVVTKIGNGMVKGIVSVTPAPVRELVGNGVARLATAAGGYADDAVALGQKVLDKIPPSVVTGAKGLADDVVARGQQVASGVGNMWSRAVGWVDEVAPGVSQAASKTVEATRTAVARGGERTAAWASQSYDDIADVTAVTAKGGAKEGGKLAIVEQVRNPAIEATIDGAGRMLTGGGSPAAKIALAEAPAAPPVQKQPETPRPIPVPLPGPTLVPDYMQPLGPAFP